MTPVCLGKLVLEVKGLRLKQVDAGRNLVDVYAEVGAALRRERLGVFFAL